MDKSVAESIRAKLDEIIADMVPDAVAREMYGGTMFEVVPGDHSTRLFGHFAYKNHVSLEFTEGASFDDPDHLLEGSGKMRRYLKFHSMDEVTAKDPAWFLRQASSHMD